MINYANDDYLLMLVHECSDDATEKIYDKYEIAVRCKAYKYKYYASKIGLDMDDLIQEGYIGLSQAILDFSNASTASFTTFANLCIEREIQNAIATAARKKHTYLNEAMSIHDTNVHGVEVINLIESKTPSAEIEVLNKLEENDEYKEVLNMLTKLESQVFILKYNGYEYREIAEILGRNEKAIDNALQRIKKKVKTLDKK